MAKLTFLGAAGTVTGSKFLLESGEARVLVECGLFQGKKSLRELNWAPLPVEASSIDAVLLTHAHIDHTGALPRLVKDGFSGPVHCTPATAELLGIMLPDSAHLQEEEARYANEKGYSRHKPALPLYDAGDAQAALSLLQTADYGREIELPGGLKARFHPSGHILGAAFVELEFEGRRLVVSGDLGSYDRVVMRGPARIPKDTRFILSESTYGGRTEDPRPVQDQLCEKLAPVLERKGVVVIPAFAVGRTTLVLYHLRRLMEAGRLPDAPIAVDSPMATEAVQLYRKHHKEINIKADLLGAEGGPGRVKLTRSVEDSKALNGWKGPAVIISASGMATGGRVLHHLKHRLPDPDNMVLLVGYQAEGTRGRRLLEGEKEVRMLGADVPVRAKVAAVNGLSAHGDMDDLLRWLGTAHPKPERTYLVHGEPRALKAMAERVKRELKHPVSIPERLQTVEI